MELVITQDHPLAELTLSKPDQSETTLVARVVRLAECLEQALKGNATLKTVGDAVGGALAAATDAEKRIAEQLERLAHFEELAVTDELTGLLNRRGFEAEIKRTMLSAKRYKEKGVLIFVDLDGFKPINDTYGHAAGDAVLSHVAALLTDNVRGTDFVARLGGDEFAIGLTRTTWDAGLKRAETFDRLINGAQVNCAGRMITIRASFGFQTYGPDDDLRELLKGADDAMYASKRARAGTETIPLPQPQRVSA